MLPYRLSIMSLLQTPVAAPSCACKQRPSTGSFSLRVEPKTVDVRDKVLFSQVQQLAESERLQNLFLPGYERVGVHQHADGFHAHPEQPDRVAHLAQLHDLMDAQDLVARLQITPSAEDTAVAVALSRDHVNDLLGSGTVDVKVPQHNGTFRLHSTRTGRLTAVEYL